MSPPGVIMGCDFLGTVEDSNGTDIAVSAASIPSIAPRRR
jgi:hypothetical protein